jgi:transmembrane sensor
MAVDRWPMAGIYCKIASKSANGHLPSITLANDTTLNMEQEHIWNLIAKKMSGDATARELQELELMMHQHPDLHYSMQTIIDLWKPGQNTDRQEGHLAFDRHVDRMERLNIDFHQQDLYNDEYAFSSGGYPASSNRYKRAFLYSAFSLTILAGIVFLAVHFFNNAPPSNNNNPHEKLTSEVSTHNGSKTNLVLPDGSQVWLNAGSKITYDKQYANTIREVNLTGEAFFDVVKNKDKPFIIHTGKIDIRVLGTAFNVKSYPGEKTIETSLIRGSIEVTFKDRPAEKVILKPNEKLVVVNEDVHQDFMKKSSVKPMNEPIVAISHLNYAKADSTVIETAWIQNKLFFQDELFKDLATQMERWYGVTIKFDNSQKDTLRFTGSFLNETVQQALDALKVSASFNYIIEGNKITISK